MTARSQREFLKVQLLETQRLRQLVGDHPLMSVGLAQRERELTDALAELPLGEREARTVLLFSGDPVQGSMGIDASFAARVLEPFQKMVMADYADRWHGVVGDRGRHAGESQSRLLLTGLPRGSFGLELTRAENDELFEEGQLADSLAHVSKLVESAARSDEDFAAEIDQTAPRVIQNLREFLEVIAKGKAGLRLETGDFRCEMNPAEAYEAFGRVDATTTREEPVTLPGLLQGVLLESRRFDFVTDDNLRISGKLDEGLTKEQAIGMNREFFNGRCVASLLKVTVRFKNGRERSSFILRRLEPLVGGGSAAAAAE